MSDAIKNRYEFVLLFDVKNGNPNGDPDAGNLPRIDPETNHGIVTDVCLKRKVRNYVELVKNGEEKFNIYVQEKAVLNRRNNQAYEALKIKPENKKLPKDKEKARLLTEWMCQNFFDIRTFGAVMSTEINCGQVRGPIQLAFSQSIDPICSMDISITRMAVTNEKDLEKERTMGRKTHIPYGLYRLHGFISAPLAKQTGFSEEDLDLFWNALMNMFDHDRSAARGEMSARKLIVFKHESELGNAPAHALFQLVKVSRHGDASLPPRDFSDYQVIVLREDCPNGVEVIERL